jgi:hypothetical protein
MVAPDLRMYQSAFLVGGGYSQPLPLGVAALPEGSYGVI